jgi:hypothetical protein
MQPPVSKSDIDRWIGYLSNWRQRRQFYDRRKSTQGTLVVALTLEGVGATPVNGDVAYSLMLLIAGRGDIPEIMRDFTSADLPGMESALRLYRDLNTASLSEAVNAAAKATRSIEISNEVAFGTTDRAKYIADGAIRLWPHEPDFYRQHGILMLALGKYPEAVAQLSAARAGNSELLNLAEPLARAERLQGYPKNDGDYKKKDRFRRFIDTRF